MLVYSENGLVDPWLASQLIVQATESLSPLVAVQPAYAHPYAVATAITTLTNLYGRRTHLNLIAGGFRNDLLAMGDDTPHDLRYERLTEYGQIVASLCQGLPTTLAGHHYRVENLRLSPPVPSQLQPEFTVSGSSPAGLAASRTLGATAIRYPEPAAVEDAETFGSDSGIRVGIIARPDTDEAWQAAEERFPPERKGQITHQLAMKATDSHWHRRLARVGTDGETRDAYWMRPFQNYQTFCPYLVGSYTDVADVLRTYFDGGVSLVILDIPFSLEDLEHERIAIDMATQ